MQYGGMADAWARLRCYPILISSHRELPLWAVSGCYPTPFLSARGLPTPTRSDRGSTACDFILPDPSWAGNNRVGSDKEASCWRPDAIPNLRQALPNLRADGYDVEPCFRSLQSLPVPWVSPFCDAVSFGRGPEPSSRALEPRSRLCRRGSTPFLIDDDPESACSQPPGIDKTHTRHRQECSVTACVVSAAHAPCSKTPTMPTTLRSS